MNSLGRQLKNKRFGCMKVRYSFVIMIALAVSVKQMSYALEESKCEKLLKDKVYENYKDLDLTANRRLGNYSGYGKKTWNGMVCYIGYFAGGVPDKYGEYYWIDGSYYSGELRGELPNGKGEFEYKQKWSFKGEWAFGVPVEGKCESRSHNQSKCRTFDDVYHFWEPFQPLAANYIKKKYFENIYGLISLDRNSVLSTLRDIYPANSMLSESEKISPKEERTMTEVKSVFDQHKASLELIFYKYVGFKAEKIGGVMVDIDIKPTGEVGNCEVVETTYDLEKMNEDLCLRISYFDFGIKESESIERFRYPIIYGANNQNLRNVK